MSPLTRTMAEPGDRDRAQLVVAAYESGPGAPGRTPTTPGAVPQPQYAAAAHHDLGLRKPPFRTGEGGVV
ncbi:MULTISPECIES: hypothetical protein [unclassified Streptomyces]|uniref:hypothetical protein n=1 Tax=unclassified Streptomyces TaxID=2593676 RepID=UPI0037FFBDCC